MGVKNCINKQNGIMKILVTGGFGFIGHTLVKELLNKGHEVHVVDCAHTYNSFSQDFTNELYKERFAHVLGRPHDLARTRTETPAEPAVLVPDAFLEPRLCDVRTASVDKDFDVIYHLAGYPRQAETKANTFDAADIHTQGLLNVLHGQENLKRIVYFSTSMVYGDFEDWVNERREPNPQSLYGFMRLTGERFLMKYCEQHDLQWNVIRPCTVYGERDTHNRILGRFMWRAKNGKPLLVKGKDVVLDFTHVSDVVQGCTKLLDAIAEGRVPNEIFNISHSKVKYTIDYLAHLIDQMVPEPGTEPSDPAGDRIEYCDPDGAFPKRSVMGIEKARILLGYEPQVSLEEGVKRTWEWFQSSNAMQHADTDR